MLVDVVNVICVVGVADFVVLVLVDVLAFVNLSA